MPQNELKTMSALVSEAIGLLSPATQAKAGIYRDLMAKADSEYLRITNAWTAMLFSGTKDHTLKRYIGHQQQIVQELADDLYELGNRFTRAEKSGDQPAALLDFIAGHLLDLKDFLIRYFYNFMNKDGKIPLAAMPSVKDHINSASRELLSVLQEVKIDAGLRTCISGYLVEVIPQDGRAITYRQEEYLTLFSMTLESELVRQHNDDDLTNAIVEQLFYLNFNRGAFSKWYVEDVIRRNLEMPEGEQPAQLGKVLLSIKTMPLRSDVSFDPSIRPVHQAMEALLTEYIQQKGNAQGSSLPDQEEKIEITLTVAQLALLVRMLFEEGVFALKNIASVLRFFSKRFMTRKREQISYGSMNKLYYGADQFTGYAVRSLLLKMVTKINKKYFPT